MKTIAKCFYVFTLLFATVPILHGDLTQAQTNNVESLKSIVRARELSPNTSSKSESSVTLLVENALKIVLGEGGNLTIISDDNQWKNALVLTKDDKGSDNKVNYYGQLKQEIEAIQKKLDNIANLEYEYYLLGFIGTKHNWLKTISSNDKTKQVRRTYDGAVELLADRLNSLVFTKKPNDNNEDNKKNETNNSDGTPLKLYVFNSGQNINGKSYRVELLNPSDDQPLELKPSSNSMNSADLPKSGEFKVNVFLSENEDESQILEGMVKTDQLDNTTITLPAVEGTVASQVSFNVKKIFNKTDKKLAGYKISIASVTLNEKPTEKPEETKQPSNTPSLVYVSNQEKDLNGTKFTIQGDSSQLYFTDTNKFEGGYKVWSKNIKSTEQKFKIKVNVAIESLKGEKSNSVAGKTLDLSSKDQQYVEFSHDYKKYRVAFGLVSAPGLFRIQIKSVQDISDNQIAIIPTEEPTVYKTPAVYLSHNAAKAGNGTEFELKPVLSNNDFPAISGFISGGRVRDDGSTDIAIYADGKEIALQTLLALFNKADFLKTKTLSRSVSYEGQSYNIYLQINPVSQSPNTGKPMVTAYKVEIKKVEEINTPTTQESEQRPTPIAAKTGRTLYMSEYKVSYKGKTFSLSPSKAMNAAPADAKYPPFKTVGVVDSDGSATFDVMVNGHTAGQIKTRKADRKDVFVRTIKHEGQNYHVTIEVNPIKNRGNIIGDSIEGYTVKIDRVQATKFD